jgi:hypothetical protein
MAAFVVTWNPDRWYWPASGRKSQVMRTAAGHSVREPWSIGNRKSGIDPGIDRVFLLRQGIEPRGIVGSGVFQSAPYRDTHWDDSRSDLANYADILWDRILDDQDRLPLADIDSRVGGLTWLRIQSGGVRVPPPEARRLEQLWTAHLAGIAKPGHGADNARTLKLRPNGGR